MSLSSARSFLSEACYGEQELDANSALMELDKGALTYRANELARIFSPLQSFALPLVFVVFCNIKLSWEALTIF